MITPFVRHMLLCEAVHKSERLSNTLDISGLISTVYAKRGVEFPITFSFSVYLALTSGRGTGSTLVRVIAEETTEEIYRTPAKIVTFKPDPLRGEGLVFEITEISIPQPGLYWVEF